ncbi:hypothetical protein BCAH820_4603 [Bacillus cereus AH820]|uniref:Uncharacterized protein n=1 Tax=Bacillus cereus (strain AH820) TaxID=405535 RepID=B7JQZ5_BACC0|nr:hypothetical protein BCAH820_4603 [Bacillus cereus AH820]
MKKEEIFMKYWISMIKRKGLIVFYLVFECLYKKMKPFYGFIFT